MAICVYPRSPSAAILDFIEAQIAPFDPADPENPSVKVISKETPVTDFGREFETVAVSE